MCAASAKRVARYGNCDVRRVVAIVPRGHRHLRMIIELPDQVVVLSEATVAAIVRAYASVVTHPTRRSIELVLRRFGRGEAKPGYAECQLVETAASEELQVVWEAVALGGWIEERAEELGPPAPRQPQDLDREHC